MAICSLFILLDFKGLLIFIICCVVGHVVIKTIWKYYITCYCVTDTELSHLPIPPGTLGYPFIGETVEFIRKVPFQFLVFEKAEYY